MNIYRLIFPRWLLVYYHAYTRSNTVLCACKILLDGIGLKEALGASRSPLCLLSWKRVCVPESEYAGSSNGWAPQRLSQTLLLSLTKQLGWGNIDSLLRSLHTSPQTCPTQRLFTRETLWC